jgi:23S rRNA (guanine745-N1)-methyltransferase
MLDDVLHLLACPHCGAALSPSDGSVACASGHSFDVAREGYVSLLPGDARLGSADTAEMVAAREAFLEAGHFDPLAEALARAAEPFVSADGAPGGEARPPCIVDLGAGPGWYLVHLLDRFSPSVGLALDLSKHALRRAARAHPRIGAVACDTWRGLPVGDGVASLVLSVFAPRNGPEIARVLRPDGALLVVTPTERHLAELVSAHALLTVDERKEERLAAELGGHFELERRLGREWSPVLTPADVANAVAMGPSARHISGEESSAGAMRATASVTIAVYRRRSG